jgi:hypothetical protein
MEKEAFFLFVSYTELPTSKYTPDDRTEIRGFNIAVKRLSLQRKERHGERTKRVRIDFDPVGKQLGYLVACFFSSKERGIILKDIIKFVTIVDTEEAALKLLSEIEKGSHKQYASRKETFDKVLIYPQLITKV